MTMETQQLKNDVLDDGPLSIKEVILKKRSLFRKIKEPPLHRWTDDPIVAYRAFSPPRKPGRSSSKQDFSPRKPSRSKDVLDLSPKKPSRRNSPSAVQVNGEETWNNNGPQRSSSSSRKLVHSGTPAKTPGSKSPGENSTTTFIETRNHAFTALENSERRAPRKPSRKLSMENLASLPPPPFLAPTLACPRPSRTGSPNVTLPNIALKPIAIQASVATDGTQRPVREGMVELLQDVVQNPTIIPSPQELETAGKDVTVVFAIRRPGCGSCREHGLNLQDLVKEKPNVNLIGVIKKQKSIQPKGSSSQEELDRQLMDFYTDYFKFPLYQDENWSLYTDILGDKKLTIWSMIRAAPKLAKRYARKSITNVPYGGDLYTRGGVLVFDKTGKLRFVYYERYGDELDLKALSWAIDEATKIPVDESERLEEDDDIDSIYESGQESGTTGTSGCS